MKTVFSGKRRSKNAYIVFTREPVPGSTKTRLMPYYSAEECAELHRCFLRDICGRMKGGDFDIIVAYTGGDPVFLRRLFGKRAKYTEQRGSDLGQRMKNAISDALAMGYEKAVLTGTDIPELRRESIGSAFDALDYCDAVIGPTADGGYWLLGMKELHSEAFNVKAYGQATVFEETIRSLKDAGLSVREVDEYHDIDTKEDIAELMSRIRSNAALRRSATAAFLRDNLKISVIVPTFNEESTAGAMKEQLKRAASDDSALEVIFADGGSTDKTLQILGDDFRVLSCSKGRGRQLNKGAMESSGDVFFFLHCDSVLPADFAEEIRRCMLRHPYGCFGVRFPSRNFFMLTNRIISNHRAFIRGLPFGDQGMFTDRGLFFESGMFPEIPLMEDYEFSLRLKKRGMRPGMTKKRIISSMRRYRGGTLSILRTEFEMWHLRRLYRRGFDAGNLADIYKDIR